MDNVYENVWIGDIQDVREGDTSRFDRVITVCQDSVEDNVGCSYEWYNMADGPHNVYGGDSSYEIFHEAGISLLGSVTYGEEVLIHCHMGQSRSASVAIAVIGVFVGSYEEAYNIVEGARPQIHVEPLLQQHAKKFIDDSNFP